MAVILQDNFNRANSTSAVGNPATGPSPVAQIGTLGIRSNRLYASAISSNHAIVTWAIGPEFDLTAPFSGTTVDVVFGWNSISDHWLVQFESDQIEIHRRGPGNYYALTQVQIPTPVQGTPCRLRLCDGVLRAWYNGEEYLSWVLDDLPTGSPVGIRFGGISTSFYLEEITVEDVTSDNLHYGSGGAWDDEADLGDYDGDIVNTSGMVIEGTDTYAGDVGLGY